MSPENINTPDEAPAEASAQEIADACRDVLSEEECESIAEMDSDEALGYSFTALIEAGIDDPEAFLIEKGILEKPE